MIYWFKVYYKWVESKTFCCAMGYIECMGWNILLLVKRIWELFLCNEMCFKLLIHLSTTYFTWFSTIPLTPIVSVAQCFFISFIFFFSTRFQMNSFSQKCIENSMIQTLSLKLGHFHHIIPLVMHDHCLNWKVSAKWPWIYPKGVCW